MIDLFPLKARLAGKAIGVLGLGISGLPVADACRAAGIDCLLWDDKEEQRDAAKTAGGALRDFAKSGFTNVGILCPSPGVPLDHPAIVAAQAASVPVMGDMELFHLSLKSKKTIGITGTNGKSTTTALIGHILQGAGRKAAVGGNIGHAVLTLDPPGKDGFFVLEMSSFQLDLCPTFAPDIAILLNISPDHIDRHGSLENYIAAKEKIFRGTGTAVIGVDDAPSREMATRLRQKGERTVIPLSVERPMMKGVFVSHEGILFDGPFKILDLHTCPNLQGQHNWQNAAAAYAALRAAGLHVDDIVKGLHSFPGLAHRQNIVTVFHGITYINDSKATNDQAASMALRTYAPIYWIAGGKSKGAGYGFCEKHLARVRHAFLLGAAENEMAQWLEKHRIPHTRCGDLAHATDAAHKLAQSERLSHATVLLSPACASLDQFKNYEERGDAFCAQVLALTHAHTPKTEKGALR